MTEQKSILITGCSTGIGHCVAHGLKERGYRVFATARKREDVERLLEEGLESLHLDLDHSDSIDAALDEIFQRTGGRLDALFNNGAYGQAGAVEDLHRDVLRAQFETNLFGTHELTCKVLPTMRRQGHGHIIHNSSVLGFVSLPYRGAYSASKHALQALADTLRMELRDTGIHVCTIEPGPITSRFRANSFAAYQRHIDKANSPHRDYYDNVEKRLQKKGPAAPFTLPPEAVLAKVVHALESDSPRLRYYVTFPTYLFAWLRRMLSHRVAEKFLLRVSRDENR